MELPTCFESAKNYSAEIPSSSPLGLNSAPQNAKYMELPTCFESAKNYSAEIPSSSPLGLNSAPQNAKYMELPTCFESAKNYSAEIPSSSPLGLNSAPQDVKGAVPVIPSDLVQPTSESEVDNAGDEDSESDVASDELQISKTEEQVNEMDEDLDETNKVGRWILSKGAARKSSKKRTTGTSDHFEDERLMIYSESQRLIRESDIHVPEHRPKQFKRFSEFRQSLHDSVPTPPPVPGTSSQETILETNQISPLPFKTDLVTVKEASKCEDAALGSPENEHSKDLTKTDGSLDPANQTPLPSLLSKKLLDLLPSLPPAHKLPDSDEGFVDLGESVITSQSFSLTPADRLMARFKQHTRMPPVRKERGPIEYTVVTKVVDDATGREELRLETVAHKGSGADDSDLPDSGVQRRKLWQQHRERLKEEMRKKRLEQYEARLREEGVKAPDQQTKDYPDQQSFSEEDEEWSEGEEEPSSDTESSSSSSSEDEAEVDNDDGDSDVGLKSSGHHHTCPFADDEAEESDDSGASGHSTSDPETKADDSPLSATVHRGGGAPVLVKENDTHLQIHAGRTEIEDFTDLPEDPVKFLSAPDITAKHLRQRQTSLGPGDVDLFLSEYSSVLDRTANTTSVIASTRLDATEVGGNLNTTRLSHENSNHSQWNNTPYELLYSQKPLSQPPPSSKENSQTVTDPGISQFSQDTVLLSQASSHNSRLDSTLKLLSSASLGSQVSQEQQSEHGDPTTTHNPSGAELGAINLEGGKQPITDGKEQGSQMEHEKRRGLFESSPYVSSVQAQTLLEGSDEQQSSLVTSCTIEPTTVDPPSALLSQTNASSAEEPLTLNDLNDELADSKRLPQVDERIENNSLRRHRVVIEDDDSLSSQPTPKIHSPEARDFGVTPKLKNENAFEAKAAVLEDEVPVYKEKQTEDIVTDANDELASEKEDSERETYSSEEEDDDQDDISLSDKETEGASDEEEAQRLALAGEQRVPKAKFRVDDFLDIEAELSGDENERAYYMDDEEDEEGLDDELGELIRDDNDPELPSAGRLRRQVERVHQRLQADQDQREIRFLKELYFEEGDLYAENGKVRQRRFRWRGLDTDDPLAAEEDCEDNDDISEEESGQATFGPLDRWLNGGVFRKPAEGTPINADNIDESAKENQAPVTAPNSDEEDSFTEEMVTEKTDSNLEKESDSQSDAAFSVLSLGKKAVLKAKTKQTQIVVQCTNIYSAKNIATNRSAKTVKSSIEATSTLVNYFAPKQKDASEMDRPATTQSPVISSEHPSPFAVSAVRSESQSRIMRRGSLLGRLSGSYTPTRADPGRNATQEQDAEAINTGEDELTHSSKGQAYFLGLRNRVGLSCFSVLSQVGVSHGSADLIPSGVSHSFDFSSQSSVPSNPGQLSRQNESNKRTSTGSTPMALKRQRSASVFSALL
ncbi:unnamed protein product [Calicophoron daubneyi]|uniref:Claspin n=1 Tax=Calicophoron daubneyi TaxID=300641 RepID=A0AAV2TTT9_CALDB